MALIIIRGSLLDFSEPAAQCPPPSVMSFGCYWYILLEDTCFLLTGVTGAERFDQMDAYSNMAHAQLGDNLKKTLLTNFNVSQTIQICT